MTAQVIVTDYSKVQLKHLLLKFKLKFTLKVFLLNNSNNG